MDFSAILVWIITKSINRAYEIFLAPINNLDMLWTLIPIYVNWVFSDFLSKKIEFNSAASTGFMYLWVSMNWIKDLREKLPVELLFLTLILFFYGLAVMVFSLGKKTIGKYLGSIRIETFILIVLHPIVFGIIPFDLITINGILIFGLIFFIVAEFLYQVIQK